MYSRKKTHLGLIWLLNGNWQMVHLPNMDKSHRVGLTLVTASVGSDIAWLNLLHQYHYSTISQGQSACRENCRYGPHLG